MKSSRGIVAALLLLTSCVAAPPAPAIQQYAVPAPETSAPARPSGVVKTAAVKPQEKPAKAAKEDYLNRRLVEIPVDRTRFANQKGAELWYTADGGTSWANHGEIELTKPSAGFLAPRDGRFGFLLVAISPDGRRHLTPKSGDAPERMSVVDTAPPVVELLAPNGGELLGAGRSTVVQWACEDANLAPAGILIEASATGKEPWAVIAKDLPNSGKYHWDIAGLTGATCRVRITARDLAGNVGADASDSDFIVDGAAPDLKITGPATASEAPVRIDYTGGDVGGSGLKRVTLWVTRDQGQTWKVYGDDEDLKPPFLFTDLDGTYGLKLAGEDRMGNSSPAPVAGMPALHTLVLDRTKPELKLISPQAGGYLGGVAVDVQWSARDNLEMPANGISLFYSEDAGKTWKDIARNVKNDGLYKWTPPRSAGADYRFKITATDLAGNIAEVQSDRFGIDATVPEARATGPDRSNSHTVQVAYEIRNRGSAPIKRATLYFRPEGMKEWLKYGDDPDAESPFLFSKADGKYAIYIACATEAGLKTEFVQKAPDEATEPQLILTIDSTPPQINLESHKGGGFLLAGAAVDITWKLIEPNPDPRGMAIFHSPDGGGTWSTVARDVDASKGSYRWIVPNFTGARHKIRLQATDRFGNRGETESEKPFTIDNELPLVSVVEKPPAVSRGTRVSVTYRSQDQTSGIDRVVLFGKSMDDNSPYKRLAETKNVEGTLESDLPGEGTWGFLVVAHDTAGHASADPERAPKPDFITTFDLGKPEITIKSSMLPQGTKTYVSNNWEVEWTATDRFSRADRIGIRIEYSSDGGRTWFVAVQRHANTGKADLRSFLFAGKKYRLRLVALDEAGNEGEDATADFDPGDVPSPGMALRGIEDGRQYVMSASLNVMWSTSDKSIREAVLEISKDGGRTWSHFASMNSPSMKIVLPDREGRYHLRALSRDSVGRTVSSNYLSFDIISGVDQVKLIANESVEPGKLMRALIEPRSILKSARELRLERAAEGSPEWRHVMEVKSTDITFPAPAAPGEYVLRVVVKSAEGREYDSNHFRFKVGGKEAAQGIRLQSFRGAQSYAAGTSRIIAVQTTADLGQVKVEFSSASGKDGSWKTITEELQIVNGGFLWRLPKAATSLGRVRVSYKDAKGVEHADQSEKDFTLDAGGAAPVVAPVAPSTDPLRLAVPLSATLKGGDKLNLKWVAPEGAAKVTLTVMIGAKAELIARDQPASGSVSWTVPKVDAKGCQIVLESGERIWRSPAFEIDSSAPEIEGVDIEIPRK